MPQTLHIHLQISHLTLDHAEIGFKLIFLRLDTTVEITGMIEKSAKGTAPSNLIISGRYVLSPEIFRSSKEAKRERAARSSSPTA
jgi:NDP-sugar pyrophosphorylase family protein